MGRRAWQQRTRRQEQPERTGSRRTADRKVGRREGVLRPAPLHLTPLLSRVRVAGAPLVESLCAAPLIEAIASVLCGFSTKAALVLGRLAALTGTKARRGDSPDGKGESHR